jgi:membrane protease YdiL (CAAX protease family)
MLASAGATVLVWLAAAGLAPSVRLWTTFLVVPFPTLMVLQARAIAQPTELPRLPLYIGSAVTQWLLALVTLACATSGGYEAATLGIQPGSPVEQLLWALVLVVSAELLILAGHRLGVRESPVMLQLLPRTAGERVGFALLSVSAGICEEVVFRGFLVTVLAGATGSMALALLLAALVFGVTHAYQHPAGAARATLLGLLLSVPLVATGSLLGAAVAHIIIDLIGGFWLGPRLAASYSREDG